MNGRSMAMGFGASPRKMAVLLCIAAMATVCRAQGVRVSLKVDRAPEAAANGEMSRSRGMNSGAVVAWLTPVDGPVIENGRSAPVQGYRLVQKNKQFTPHLLVVPTGSSIEFPNLDPFFHNVFSLFNGKRFDLGLYETGSRRAVRFDREGVSYIFCNIHPEMGAVVISLSTPLYAMSAGGLEGLIAIDHVPPGTYKLKLWAENATPEDLAAAERRVTVAAADVAVGAIVLTARAQAPANHKNKFGEDYRPTKADPY